MRECKKWNRQLSCCGDVVGKSEDRPENQHRGIRILGEQIAILERRACSSFAALQESVQRGSGGRGGWW